MWNALPGKKASAPTQQEVLHGESRAYRDASFVDSLDGSNFAPRCSFLTKVAVAKVVFVLVLLCFGGCPDPPLYESPLPNGYTHESNGGEFGFITKDTILIAPLGPRDEKWCNNFGWVDNLVVYEVIVYAERAFVDPPKSIEFLILDTRIGVVRMFKTKNQLNLDGIT